MGRKKLPKTRVKTAEGRLKELSKKTPDKIIMLNCKRAKEYRIEDPVDFRSYRDGFEVLENEFHSNRVSGIEIETISLYVERRNALFRWEFEKYWER